MIGAHLIAMAGLPGAGKSSIANGLCKALRATVLSVDPIEAAMWRSGLDSEKTGRAAYSVAQSLAIENLRQGQIVIIDAVNPVEEARSMWLDVARELTLPISFIEAICDDEAVHRARIEARVRGIEGMPEVTWAKVQERRMEYQAWSQERLVLDTATRPVKDLVVEAIAYVNRASRP